VRILLNLLGWLLSLTLLALLGAGVMVYVDSRPLVPQDRELRSAELDWAKGWLRSARPRGMREGERATLTLSQAEAEVLGLYLLERVGSGRIRVRMEPDRVRLAASLGLPWDPRGGFINAEIDLREEDGRPRIESARLAGLPLPRGLAQGLADQALRALDGSGMLEVLDIQAGVARLTYRWHRNAVNDLGSGLLDTDERAAALHYQGLLAARGGATRERLALADLLTDLLREAHRRSRDADPTAENRALVLALAAYVNRRTVRADPDHDGAPTWVPRPFHPVVLRGRRDLAQHFATSAALTAQGGDTLSDLVGLFKELSDANGGSGFSFPDLAADRAGTRFAELAVGNETDARSLQSAALVGLREDDFMPAIDGLPEGLAKEDFATLYGDTRGPPYRRMSDEIERRIDHTRLYVTGATAGR
jgi:hypothetical protein